jgi:hypothetical protein
MTFFVFRNFSVRLARNGKFLNQQNTQSVSVLPLVTLGEALLVSVLCLVNLGEAPLVSVLPLVNLEKMSPSSKSLGIQSRLAIANP